MKSILPVLALLLSSFCFAQLTFIPDDNFEEYLETHDINGSLVSVGSPESMGNGILGDNNVLTTKISNCIEIHLNNGDVTDLTGINEFTSLSQLYVYSNQISELELSIPTLWTLGCSNNSMTSLNVSGCPNLANLVCNNNLLETIDLSSNLKLDEVYLNNNLLIDVDLSSNEDITHLYVNNNSLLNSFDLRNRSNPSTPIELEITSVPNLKCLFVDNITPTPAGWSLDDSINFVENEAQCNDILSVSDFSVFEASVYPNPTNGSFKITTNQQVKAVEVIDLFGKTVSVFKTSETYKTTNLTAGVYLLKIRTNNSTITKKLMLL